MSKFSIHYRYHLERHIQKQLEKLKDKESETEKPSKELKMKRYRVSKELLNRIWNGIYNIVTKYAERLGLHDPKGKDLRKKIFPHRCRHWFTTHLRRVGMPREVWGRHQVI